MILNVNPIRIAVFGCLVLRFFLLVGGYVGLLAMFSFVIRTLMFQAEKLIGRYTPLSRFEPTITVYDSVSLRKHDYV